MNRFRHALRFLLVSAFFAAAVFAQGVPAPYTPRLQPFLTGLSRPILIKGSGDGSRRLFIVQQGGLIRVLQPGSATPTDFINLTSKITVPVTVGDERGLLGIAFHPQFAANGRFFVNYTRVGDGTTVVEEYRTVNGNPNQGDTATARILFTVPQPFSNHNGGNIEFGPDGYLYIGMGDGGSADDPGNRAQNPAQLLGKMLRIDVNIPNGSPVQYLIPPTNPFTGAGTARCDTGSTSNGTTCQEIWTIGMRNPYRWSFDRGGTNQLWAGDVGQNAIEEVDVISSGGGNYGWRVYEGNNCNTNIPGNCPATLVQIPPVITYTHTAGRCSIIGGYVYRGTLGSLPNGAYTYGDYCSGEIWMWLNNTQILLQDTPRNVVSFGQDEDGEIYVCYSNGQIDKIVRAKASADFDGDFRTDLSTFFIEPSLSRTFWRLYRSSNNTFNIQEFGLANDIPAPEDFDGDNITDLGVFRPSNGTWYYLASGTQTVGALQFGTNGDIPAAGDYDGDARSDFTVFRPSTGVWWTFRSATNSVSAGQFGLSTDVPVAGDYDGDCRYDIAVFRPSDGNWYVLNSSNGAYGIVHFGQNGDRPSPGDFDGDGKIDNAVFRPSNGLWYILRSSNFGIQITQWGLNGDIPAVGDYDGDGRDDITIFRNGTWWGIQSSNSATFAAQLGFGTELPVPAYDTP